MVLLVQNTDSFSAAFPTGNLVLKMLGLYYTGSFLVFVEASAPETQWKATLAIASTLSSVCGNDIDWR